MEILIILGLGVMIGMYVSSQIKCHTRQNIFNNNLKKYDEKEKTE